MIKANSIEQLHKLKGIQYGIASLQWQISTYESVFEGMTEDEQKRIKRKIEEFNGMIAALEKLYIEVEKDER